MFFFQGVFIYYFCSKIICLINDYYIFKLWSPTVNSIFICIHGIFPSISLDETPNLYIWHSILLRYIYISVLSQSIFYFLKPNIYWYDHVNYNPSKNLISSGNRTNFSVESCLTNGHMNFCYHNVSIVNFSTF